jgi:hypothetical protein
VDQHFQHRNSVLFQSGTGRTAKLGINTITPASTLDVKGAATIRGLFSLPAGGTATAAKGFNSQAEELTASAFNKGTSKPVTQNFQWQAEPVGNDTSTASGSLNLLLGQGANKLAETGLNIANNGQITFATGQTFPGTGDGTITGVTTAAGSGLIGGGTSGKLNLSLTDTCGSKQVSAVERQRLGLCFRWLGHRDQRPQQRGIDRRSDHGLRHVEHRHSRGQQYNVGESVAYSLGGYSPDWWRFGGVGRQHHAESGHQQSAAAGGSQHLLK